MSEVRRIVGCQCGSMPMKTPDSNIGLDTESRGTNAVFSKYNQGILEVLRKTAHLAWHQTRMA
jgi:hypothetical protein